MLKFSVQIFYQPHFRNSSLAILLQQFFSLPKPPTSKSPQAKSKRPPSSFRGSFILRGKQGGTAVLGAGHDIVTGETCIPASLKVNNLGEAAVLLTGAVPI
jgi:hypothetical protein